MKQTVKPFLSLLILFAGAITPAAIHAQEISGEFPPAVSLKTNLLYDATTTFNIGAEFRLGEKTTLEIPINYNPWTFSDNKKWKHVLVQPEYRKWTKQAFRGHFFGLHGHYSFYNVGGLDNPPFSEYMNTHRMEGWLAGAGISYGYRWNFGYRWGLEATIGAGYAFLSYDEYPCNHCGEKLGSKTKNYVGPTKAGISLIYNIGGKKKQQSVETPVVPFVEPVPEPVKIATPYTPQLAVSFLTPEVETVKKRSATGKAYLDFVVAKWDILPNFRNNATELQQIYDLIERIKDDSDTTITGIIIAGYASPEGTYNSNLTLSGNRASALAAHLQKKYKFSKELFHLKGNGEDWNTLETLVEQSDLKDKQEILSIIRGTGIFDGREKKLMDLSRGVPYRRMKEDFFPQLRRTDYELTYTVLPFTVEKGKEVFKTNPSSLSLNEMFLIANTYPQGSDAFNEVFETAARVFPQDNTANLNAAASALSRKDAVSAAKYLKQVTDYSATYWNNLGVMYFLLGDKGKASDCFAKATTISEGIKNRNELERHLKSFSI